MRSYDEIDSLSCNDRTRSNSNTTSKSSNDVIKKVMRYGDYIAQKEQEMYHEKSFGDYVPR